MSTTPATASQTARRAAAASFAGAVVDWYDFYLYGITAALIFSRTFFPDVSPATGTLAAFATFGVGFLFRPLGGIVFGHFGDRIGRKRMLVMTMVIMGVATALIGVLPSYAAVGVWAPVLLTMLRAVQGFAVGGEWGGAALMAVESAPVKWKTLFSSGVQVGASVGLLIATAAVTITSKSMSDADFLAWGWRIPFLLSIILVLVGLVIRSRVSESPEFTQKVEKGAQVKSMPLLAAIRNHPTAFLAIIGLRLPELFTFFLVTTFALSYGTSTLGLSRNALLPVNIVVGAIAIATIPAFAYAADRWGRRRIYLLGSLVGAIGAIPFFFAMESGSLVLIYVAAIFLVNVSHDLVVSVQQPLFTEMFGASYRYSGAGVGYQLASAVGGGFTPFIATALVIAGSGSWAWVAVYLIVGCLIAAGLAWRLPNDHRRTQSEVKQAADQPSAMGARSARQE